MTDPAAGQAGMIDLELEPLDVLFFRDGRSFDTAARVGGGLPMPQTVAGALRTWLLGRVGCDFGALAAAVRKGAPFVDAAADQGPGPAAVGRLGIRGPWFARNGERLVPTPVTIEVDDSDCLHRLDPLADDLPGWPGADNMRPLWRRSRGAAKPRGGYLGASGLARFLEGGVPRPDDDVVDAAGLFDYENRTGIGIDAATGTTGDGMIYSTRMMRLRPGVTLAVELVGAPADLTVCPEGDDVLALGGEGRRAVVRKARVPAWPAVQVGGQQGRLVVLTTPAPFGGWRPPELPLAAAAVPGNVPVSGWDLARNGPKPNRFAVAAGSVYFLDGSARLDGRNGSLCAPEDAALGWGAYVEGAWSHA